MNTESTKLKKKGKPLYLLLGLVPTAMAITISFAVTFAAIFAYSFWLKSQGVADSLETANLTAEFLYSHNIDITMVFQVLALLIVSLWYWFAYARKKKLMQLPEVFTLKQSLLPIALLALGLSQAISLVMLAEGALLPQHMAAYEQLMEAIGIGKSGIPVFVCSVILAPLMEEMLFRGLTIQILKRTGWRFWAVNLIQAALFGVFHLNLIQGIYAFVLGFFLGFIYETYGSLKAPMLLHALFNICGSYLTELLDKALSQTPSQAPNILLGIVGVALTAVAIRLILKETGAKRQALACATAGSEAASD